jgi:hypothetical protein
MVDAGGEMGLRSADPRQQRWLVDENDFGGPMVEHVHAGGPAIAIVLAGSNGREFARCTLCGGQKWLDVRREAPTTSH